ncbi:MAG TPA: DNA polymerase III subunit epsilon [Rikenellaceae bacterium]|nr:DNA polymerase III subunit epsilon [Rikenellaceae bacterium]HBH21618.1 DNA polymerase III subunit epsilon [Rikenellaceae bacterium]
MELNLDRPLLFFDIESTGLNIPADSIVELSFVKVFPGGETRIKTWKIKPWDYEKGCQRPMNPEASKVNGVTDDMLVNCPTFYECAPEIAQWLKDSDLAGFNSSKFDLPMLAEEFERAKLAGLDLHVDLHEPLMVDVQNIFHTMEPRNLKAAYRFYCGGADFDNAHTAEADTVATYEVLKAQLDRYSDTLKNNVKSLAAYAPKRYVDFAGTLIYNDKNEPVINFGKHKGKSARDVYNSEQSYFKWIQQGNFSLETKAQFARLEEEYAREKLCDKFNVRPLKPETRK